MRRSCGTTIRNLVLTTAALGAVAPAFGAGPVTAATWSAPVTIAPEAVQNDEPQFGFSADGTGLATWSNVTCGGAVSCRGTAGYSRRAASRRPDGRLGASLGLPFYGEMSTYGRDRAVLFGNESVVFGSTHGTFGAARSSAMIINAHAVNDRGQMAIASLLSRSGAATVRLAERPRGGRFGAPRTIAGTKGARSVAVAVGARGDVALVWERAGRVQARLRRPGGRLGPVIKVGRGSPNGTRLWVEVAATGAVWVLWQNRALPADVGPFTLRLALRRPDARAFDTARVLDRRAQQPAEEADSASAELALDPAGTAHVAWSGSAGTRVRAKLRSVTAAGAASMTRLLSSADHNAAVYGLATSARAGEVLVTWTQQRADLGDQVLAAVIVPGAAFAGEELVSTGDRAGSPVGAFDPRSGAPTIVWSQATGPLESAIEARRQVLRAATRIATP
jgi:hypothetical protein